MRCRLAQRQVTNPTSIFDQDKRRLIHSQTIPITPCTLRAVGFNPFRAQEKSTLDVLLVAFFLCVIIGVVLWALLG